MSHACGGVRVGDFQGKTAIVTGAASGVGREVMRQLAEQGASVVAVDVAPSVRELEAESVLPLEGDTSVPSTAERAVEAAGERFGGVDVLVNNAGSIVMKPFLETSDDDWERVLAVNVMSMVFHCRAAIPAMERRGGGAIVSTASISGVVGLAQQAAYCASKGAIIQLTRALAIEYAPARIRVNAVAPGAIDTPFLHRLFEGLDDPAPMMASIEAAHPLGRLATAESVARSIVFLASDDADFVTGEVLMVDGGYTAR